MRAVTWTQVAQYIMLILAYLCRWCGSRSSRPACRCRWSVVRHAAAARQRARAGAARTTRRNAGAARCFRRAPTSSRASCPTCRRRSRGPRGGADGEIRDAEGAERAAARRSRRPRRRSRRCRATRPSAREIWTGAGDERGARAAAGRHAAACARPSPAIRTASRRAARASTIAPQLPRAGVLPDARHGGDAARADALLHHAVGARRRARRSPGRCSSSCCCT